MNNTFFTDEPARTEELSRSALELLDRHADEFSLEEWTDEIGDLAWSADLEA